MSPALAQLISMILNVAMWIVIARVLLSWVVRDPSNPIMRFLSTLTDPILRPLRPYLTIGMIDLSPIVLIFALQALQGLVHRWAYGGF